MKRQFPPLRPLQGAPAVVPLPVPMASSLLSRSQEGRLGQVTRRQARAGKAGGGGGLETVREEMSGRFRDGEVGVRYC